MYATDRNSRRRFLQHAGLGIAALSMAAPLRRAFADASPQNAITPQGALDRLMAGNARYAANKLDLKDFSAGRAARAKAQYPIASILSCADSRVAPELIFDQKPGDLFVVRVAGNYLDVNVLSSLEYGVARSRPRSRKSRIQNRCPATSGTSPTRCGPASRTR